MTDKNANVIYFWKFQMCAKFSIQHMDSFLALGISEFCFGWTQVLEVSERAPLLAEEWHATHLTNRAEAKGIFL